MTEPSAWSRYVAECLGTFSLLLIGGGTAVFTLPPDPFTIRVLVVSASFGLGLIGLIYAFGDISGAHFNPAVTLSLAASGRFRWKEVPGYIVAQLVGGLVGMGVVYRIATDVPGYRATAAQSTALASQCFSGYGAPSGCAFSPTATLLLEVAIGFVFILVIQLVTRAESSAKNIAPIAIGFTLLVGNLLAIPIDGASMNPVRSFAPALWAGVIWPSARWALSESWMFWVAPILGGLLAALAERSLRR